ncbi:MAG: nucleotidyltransferase family protein [Propionibacteriaceae bacterium]|nr:nucleotidyltransferase family protein [Micropruina sp.]
MADPAPEALQQRALARYLVARNDRAAARMVAAFRGAGIEPILLKGAATRTLLDLDERVSADIDLLVMPVERRRAERFLRSCGYRRAAGIHSDSWTHPSDVPVDLHRTLPRIALSPADAAVVLRRHTTTLSVAGQAVLTLDVPAQLVHLAIHATQDATDQPKDELALAAQVVGPHDWQAAVVVAHELGVAPTVAWALTSVGAAHMAERFGPARLAVNDRHEAGLTGYLSSSAHWTERGRRQLRLAENWLRWQRGRLARLVTGRSALYSRWRARRSGK